jgi:hypothetical protein
MQPISSNYRSTPPSSAVQVNHGNPIARGLQRAWFASTGIDHVSGVPAVNSAATHNVPGQNQFGATLRCSGAQAMESYTVPHITAMDGGREVTVFTVSTTNSGAERPLAGVWGAAGSRQFYLAIDSSRRPLVAVTDGSTNRVYAADVATTPAGRRVTVAGGWKSSGDACSIWLNGSPVAGTKTGTAISAMPTVSNLLSIATQGTGEAQALSGDIELVLVFNRLLSDAEIRSLSANPYQILRPANDRLWLDVVSSGVSSVDTSININFNLLNSTQETSTSSWNVLTSSQSLCSPSYNILNSVSENKSVQWNTIVSINVPADFSWSTLSTVNGQQTLGWNSLVDVISNKPLEWSTVTSVATNKGVDWNIYNSTSLQLSTDWQILQNAVANKTIDWDILSNTLTAQSSVNIEYSVLQNIFNSLSGNWNVLTNSVATSDLQWNVHNNVQNNSSLLWSISSNVTSDLNVISSILGTSTEELSVVWNSAGVVNTSLNIQYSILNGSSVVIAKTIVVKKQDKSIILSKQDKSIIL